MTAKEKAKELFNKFNQYSKDNTPDFDKYFDQEVAIRISKYSAKQCAIIAVDEILNHHSQEQGLYRIDTYYWKQVKTEIENL